MASIPGPGETEKAPPSTAGADADVADTDPDEFSSLGDTPPTSTPLAPTEPASDLSGSSADQPPATSEPRPPSAAPPTLDEEDAFGAPSGDDWSSPAAESTMPEVDERGPGPSEFGSGAASGAGPAEFGGAAGGGEMITAQNTLPDKKKNPVVIAAIAAAVLLFMCCVIGTILSFFL
jgi:hypothetical protein